ncbi:MAG TPA: sigma factor [Rubrobacter sp.]
MGENTAGALRAMVGEIYRSNSRRVFATLVRLLGDFDLAEDAMHNAFAVALERWPKSGVPANPRAWLVSAGRFKAIDALRRRSSWSRRAPPPSRPGMTSSKRRAVRSWWYQWVCRTSS